MTSIEAALDSDRPAIEGLLAGGGLPLDGLELALSTAVVARAGGGVVGCAAIEPYGSIGPLRSVCVAPGLRGTGLGRKLVTAAEALAVDRGIGELYLLTDTAIRWFPLFGYEAAERSSVPAQFSASPEFTGACPESAEIFRKQL